MTKAKLVAPSFLKGLIYALLIIVPLVAPLFLIALSQDHTIKAELKDRPLEVVQEGFKENYARFYPDKVFKIGLYVEDISNIRVGERLFQSRFIYWGKNFFDQSTNHRSLIDKNELKLLNNADVEIKTKSLRPIQKGEPFLSYISYNAKGDLQNEFFLKDYPFDIHTLRYIVTPKNLTAEDILLTVDENSALSQSIDLGEWQITAFKGKASINTSQSDFSDPHLIAKGALFNYSPQVTFEISIQRRILSHLLKELLPLLIIMLIAYSNFFVNPLYFDARSAISITAVLSVAALHWSASSELPGVSYLTAMDHFFLSSYSLLLLVAIESVLSLAVAPDKNATKAQITKAYQHPWLKYGVPAMRILFPIFLAGSWYWIALKAMS